MLPESLIDEIKQQLVYVRNVHNNDLSEGFGRVYLPHVLNKGGRGVRSPLDV